VRPDQTRLIAEGYLIGAEPRVTATPPLTTCTREVQMDAQDLTPKVCSRCLQTKAITEFHRNTKARDGYRPDCKSCCLSLWRDRIARVPRPSRAKPGRSFAERFWEKVDRSGGADSCWPWSGTRWATGYGRVAIGTRRRAAHRVAWELTFGPLPSWAGPDSLCALHRCDNPPCCNPAHLFLGTSAENNHDRHAKGRDGSAPCEENGRAKLTEAQVAEVRARLTGGATERSLAMEFGVTKATIHKIKYGRRWRSVFPHPVPVPGVGACSTAVVP
jgi:hypothetical protein